MDPAFRDTFLPDAAKYEKAQDSGKKKGGKKTSSASHGDEKTDEAAAVVRAFAEANKENALKTRPKVSTPCFHDDCGIRGLQEDYADSLITGRRPGTS